MKLTAHVAPTPDKRDNVNHLRLPEFGVAKLVLTAGGKTSKAHYPGWAEKPKETDNGIDTLTFAPGPRLDPTSWSSDASLTDPVKVTYQVIDPTGLITKAVLELFIPGKDTAVWTRELTAEEFKHGDHTLKFGDKDTWDGAVDKAEQELPDGYVTAEFSPYKMRLSVEGAGRPFTPAVWTFFHVTLAKLELLYGEKTVLPVPVPGKGDHREVHASLLAQGAKPPADGATVKVFLKSNIFKKGYSMMDNSLFDVYKDLWGDGPLIPLFVKIYLKDSGGKDVVAPMGIGTLKFMWDWESKSVAATADFVKKAQDYRATKTKPKGLNCHADRGGKRGRAGKPVFPPQAGIDPVDPVTADVFPFKVEALPDTAKRPWSAYSYAWREKALAGRTGVLFQPARMAGDAYVVTVYAAYHRDVNGLPVIATDADAPLSVAPALKISTGTFEIWRKTHFVRYRKKTAAAPTLSIAGVTGYYQPAFVEMENTAGAPTVIDRATWNAAVTNAISGWTDVEKLMIDSSVDQYNKGPAALYFRSRAEFRKQWIKRDVSADLTSNGVTGAKNTTVTNAAAGAANAGAASSAASSAAAAAGCNASEQTAIAGWVQAAVASIDGQINGATLNTDAGYAEFIKNKAMGAIVAIFDPELASAADGVTLFQTKDLHNYTHHETNKLLGYAADFNSGTANKAAFITFDEPADYAGTADSQEQTAAHEFGHHFFLPHPKDTGEKLDYSAHDTAVNDCLMSYNTAVTLSFCGLCCLRLRGWSKDALKTVAADNQKT